MNVLESSQDLIEKIADMIITEVLCLQQFVQICLHECLDDIAGPCVKVTTLLCACNGG